MFDILLVSGITIPIVIVSHSLHLVVFPYLISAVHPILVSVTILPPPLGCFMYCTE